MRYYVIFAMLEASWCLEFERNCHGDPENWVSQAAQPPSIKRMHVYWSELWWIHVDESSSPRFGCRLEWRLKLAFNITTTTRRMVTVWCKVWCTIYSPSPNGKETLCDLVKLVDWGRWTVMMALTRSPLAIIGEHETTRLWRCRERPFSANFGIRNQPRDELLRCPRAFEILNIAKSIKCNDTRGSRPCRPNS